MRKLVCLALCFSLLLTGCSVVRKQEKYTATFLEIFDTVTTVVGFAPSQEEFTATAQAIRDSLLQYHQLFDIYNDYEGINNLKTVNDAAGDHPVAVDQKIIDLLQDCKRYYTLTGGRVNAALGSVLTLWHDARTDGIHDPMNAYTPDTAQLTAAADHCSIENIIIDEAASTVFLADPQMRLDVGAIAKGWSLQRVCEAAPEGMLISVGGNVCATGPKDKNGTPWVVGVQNPDDNSQNLHTLYLKTGSVVTSGDYQRRYWVQEQMYHHIIDPDTLFPSKLWRAVTVVCDDSGLADALSTALFLLPLEEGLRLAAQCGAEAMWINGENARFYSPGFEALIRT